MSDKKTDFTVGSIVTVILPAITAFIGVVYATYFNGVSSKDSAQYTRLLETKFAAYVDYANASRLHERNPSDNNAEMLKEQAAVRIGVYGTEAVVHSIAEDWRANGLATPCQPWVKGELAVYESMRKEVFAATPTAQTRTDLAVIIYGCKIA